MMVATVRNPMASSRVTPFLLWLLPTLLPAVCPPPYFEAWLEATAGATIDVLGVRIDFGLYACFALWSRPRSRTETTPSGLYPTAPILPPNP